MTKAIVLVSFLFGACEVGEVPTNQQGQVDSGGGTHDSGGGGSDAPVALCAARITPAVPKHTHTAGQTDNAGQDCTSAGCHNVQNQGTGATPFQLAGTLYGPDKVTPNAGATITATLGGTTVKAVSDDGGNFYFMKGVLPGFPNQATATTAVDVAPCASGPTPMITPISSGGCNGSACHGGAQGSITLTPVI